MSGTRRLLRRPSALALLVVGSLLAVGGAVGGLAAPARAATSITINGASGGKTFDGLGAVSGGGNSRLLIDYPEPQRVRVWSTNLNSNNTADHFVRGADIIIATCTGGSSQKWTRS
ncbi:hypothetical protein [Micromonospora haikouensis]|uniref:hypothetical protein n=1 Tax=Micromonospora haikouensis TaxID=686309 RepID=UPI003D8E086E